MYIFDTHAHYDDESFDKDREEVLKAVKEQGVGRIVNVGTSLALGSIQMTITMTEKYEFVYGAAGIHPEYAMELENEDFYAELEACLGGEKIVALGEIGLDYHYEDNPAKEIQKKHFEGQLELAKKLKMPVILHSRDAARDTLDIVKLYAGKVEGIIHCFSYGTEMAREFLNLGFYIGIGGVLTFKNAKKLKEVVKYAPLDRIVIETDCPYLTPEPNRGKRNHSGNLIFVIKELAALKGVTENEIIKAVCDNGNRVYKIDAHGQKQVQEDCKSG